MNNEVNKEDANNLELAKETANETKEPSLCQVVIHNDDFTPMEFVVKILELFFYMSRSKASDVMLEAHMKGKAICGVFSRDIAEAKVAEIVSYAQLHEHPLHCSMEAA